MPIRANGRKAFVDSGSDDYATGLRSLDAMVRARRLEDLNCLFHERRVARGCAGSLVRLDVSSQIDGAFWKEDAYLNARTIESQRELGYGCTRRGNRIRWLRSACIRTGDLCGRPGGTSGETEHNDR
jgi:hypothetical protein